MLKDIKDTPTYQRLVAEGREEGVLLGMRQSIVALVKRRFPKLLATIEPQVDQIADQAKLQEILLIVSFARTPGEIRQRLPDFLPQRSKACE